MTTNVENQAKAWILGLDPSILERISKEQWFSKCFLSLQLVLSRPRFILPQNGFYSPSYVQGFVLQLVRTEYFYYSKKGLFAAASSSDCSSLHLILRFTTTMRLNFTAVSTPCLDLSVCIYFGAFQLLLCISIAFITSKKNT